MQDYYSTTHKNLFTKKRKKRGKKGHWKLKKKTVLRAAVNLVKPLENKRKILMMTIPIQPKYLFQLQNLTDFAKLVCLFGTIFLLIIHQRFADYTEL